MPIRLIAPPHTPLDANGKLNLDVVELQAKHYRETGVSGAFVCGSTGEGPSLSTCERKQLLQRWVQVASQNDLEVIAHVGSNCHTDAIKLSRHAAEIGVQGVAAMTPYYFKPSSVENLIGYFEPIANMAGDIPFFIYDIPVLTGVHLSPFELLKAAAQRIPNFRGIKYTNSDLAQMQQCMAYRDGAFDIWYGCDEALLAAYALGVKSAVGSSYNYMASTYLDMARHFDEGQHEQARQLQLKSVQVIHFLAQFGYTSAAKSVMSLFGIDCGPARPPLAPTQPSELDQIKRFLEANQLLHSQVST